MKKLRKTLLIVLFSLFVAVGFSQPPQPPDGSTNNSNNQLNGNAPVGSGLFILLGLGAAYGGRKIWKMREVE